MFISLFKLAGFHLIRRMLAVWTGQLHKSVELVFMQMIYDVYAYALKLFYSEKLYESLTGIESVNFWSPVRCSNHWAALTQMVSEGYIYVVVDGSHTYCQSASLDSTND